YKDYLNYQVNTQTGTIRSKWLRSVNSQEYREGMLYTHKLITEHNLFFWIYDASRYSAPNVSDQVWLTNVFTPLLTQTNLKKTASILSGDVIMQMVAEQIRVKALPIMIDKLQYQSFHDLESAEEWIFEIS
ncbi:hypothetical protein, partial [Pontibacter rugosus]